MTDCRKQGSLRNRAVPSQAVETTDLKLRHGQGQLFLKVVRENPFCAAVLALLASAGSWLVAAVQPVASHYLPLCP